MAPPAAVKHLDLLDDFLSGGRSAGILRPKDLLTLYAYLIFAIKNGRKSNQSGMILSHDPTHFLDGY
jgi:hypothetical protein